MEHWHNLDIGRVFKITQSNEQGLLDIEAKERQKKFGLNILPSEKPYSKLRLLFDQFNSPLMLILCLTVVATLFLSHYSDAIFITFVLLINTVVGFYQENKANNSLSALKKMVKITARVLRGGDLKEIDASQLVVGDIIYLKTGQKVPADARIIQQKNLLVNEAILTGESLAVQKNEEIFPENANVADRKNMVFSGTIVESGEGKAVVVSIGSQTQIGLIFSLLKETKERKTPLQRKVSSLSRKVGIFVLAFVAVIVLVGIFKGAAFSEMIVSALALAVSAIPEGMLPAITVILVLGMRRIFKSNGLVRKLAATETLGSVTTICTDKTGTLTEGRMQVSHILTANKELMRNSENGFSHIKNSNYFESHMLALKIATLANDGFIENPKAEFENWVLRGSPTEKALILASAQAGLLKNELEEENQLIDKISFSSDIKFAASLRVENNRKTKTLFVVGAPEVILSKSVALDIDGKEASINEVAARKLINKFEDLTSKGLRVLAVAQRVCSVRTKCQKAEGLMEKLTLVGFVALKDPLRQDVRETMNITQGAGIKTVLITGDHKKTAIAVAQEIGLAVSRDSQVIEGEEMEKIDDGELLLRAQEALIYARVSPKHKLRIVKALQENGEVVAMLGDGVNDAPALKAADVGVALSSGSDVAKEASDLVLLDDNFKTVIKAIEQGRIVFENIRKVFVYLVADDFSELFMFVACMLFGLPLPLLPAQILWINVVEDGFPDIALTTEQESSGAMKEKPRSPKEPILNKAIKQWMAALFFITGLAAFLAFIILLKTTGGNLEKTRTIVFALMCFDSLVFALSVRSFKRSIFRKDIFSNRILLLAVLVGLGLLIAGIYTPILQGLLKTQSLALNDWILIILISFLETILIEISKKIIFNRQKKTKKYED